MVRHLPYGLVGKDLGVRVCFLDGVRIVRPAWLDRRVAGLLEHVCPTVPAARQKPETMDKDDRRAARAVCALNLLIENWV